MKNLMLTLTILLISAVVNAQDRIELGIGAGTTHPISGDEFKRAASSGNSQNYWFGYGLSKNWAVELGLDQLDFDSTNSKHRAIVLAGVYRWNPENYIHPIAKLGLTSVESTASTNLKTNSLGAKTGAGIEADFHCVSVGVLFNLHHILKSDDAANFQNSQALMPILYLTFHNAFGHGAEAKVTPVSTAPTAAPVAWVTKPDADKDGINDEDDKCTNTPSGDVVNNFGCSENEKASVRLNVVFASGKSDLENSSNSEIENFADFMKKFTDTKVEISGHTDNLGDAKLNQTLSQKRAEAVKAALVKAGVEASRVTAKGYGSSQSISDNKTKASRDQNRRVTAEISTTVTKKK